MLCVEDLGGLTEKRNVGSFIQFSLIPALCKKTGSLSIDQLILHELKPNMIGGIEQLAKTVRIKEIVYAPLKKKKADPIQLLERIATIAPVRTEPAYRTKEVHLPLHNLNVPSDIKYALTYQDR